MVEKLSGRLEKETMSTPEEFHRQVVDETGYCARRGDILVEHVGWGYARREWQFRVSFTTQNAPPHHVAARMQSPSRLFFSLARIRHSPVSGEC